MAKPSRCVKSQCKHSPDVRLEAWTTASLRSPPPRPMPANRRLLAISPPSMNSRSCAPWPTRRTVPDTPSKAAEAPIPTTTSVALGKEPTPTNPVGEPPLSRAPPAWRPPLAAWWILGSTRHIVAQMPIDEPAGKPESASRRGDFQILRIELEGIQPAIWRTLVVPKSANLGWVHAVIQVAMGWTNVSGRGSTSMQAGGRRDELIG